MKWRKISLRVDPADVEIAAAILGGANLAVDAPAGADGRRAPRPQVSAYIPLAASRAAAARARASLATARSNGLLRSARFSTSSVSDRVWATSWKSGFRPAKIASNLYVVPPWRRAFRAPRGARSIAIDPGMAFGTGRHPTTRMALRLVLRFARRGAPMVDVGCGSGILAIAAAALGADAYACDVDPVATRAARANFRSNGLRPRALVTSRGVPPRFPDANVLAANIDSETLADLMPSLARKVQRGGFLVSSGVTPRGRAAVLSAARRCGLTLARELRSDGWIAFAHRKP
jgi:ribosomal protein L11 methyltransferase